MLASHRRQGLGNKTASQPLTIERRGGNPSMTVHIRVSDRMARTCLRSLLDLRNCFIPDYSSYGEVPRQIVPLKPDSRAKECRATSFARAAGFKATVKNPSYRTLALNVTTPPALGWSGSVSSQTRTRLPSPLSCTTRRPSRSDVALSSMYNRRGVRLSTMRT